MFSRNVLLVGSVAAGLFGLAALTLNIDVRIKDVSAASMTNAASPTAPLSELEVYYPGTEGLKPDEMRIVALHGYTRPQTQAGRGVLAGGIG